MAYPAVITHYLPATNTRGARIVARSVFGRIILPYPYGADAGEPAHRVAAEEWLRRTIPDVDPSRLVAGGMPDDDGYAFVVRPEETSGRAGRR